MLDVKDAALPHGGCKRAVGHEGKRLVGGCNSAFELAGRSLGRRKNIESAPILEEELSASGN